MSTIDITKDHSIGLDSAKAKAEAMARQLEGTLNIKWSWQGDNIQFKAERGVVKGMKGTLSVTETTIRVQIDLPMLLRAIKGTVAKQVQGELDKL